jgi:hypothetical protein
MPNREDAEQAIEDDDDRAIAVETGREAERALGAPEALIEESSEPAE